MRIYNARAGRKLFDYYNSIPMHLISDTLNRICNHLDDYLEVLVKLRSLRLIERLNQDYYEWAKLAVKSSAKRYPAVAEMCRLSSEESLKLITIDLLVECNFTELQIACVLNYLELNGFDNSLI